MGGDCQNRGPISGLVVAMLTVLSVLKCLQATDSGHFAPNLRTGNYNLTSKIFTCSERSGCEIPTQGAQAEYLLFFPEGTRHYSVPGGGAVLACEASGGKRCVPCDFGKGERPSVNEALSNTRASMPIPAHSERQTNYSDTLTRPRKSAGTAAKSKRHLISMASTSHPSRVSM